jgi:hypothetical protein
MLTVVPARRFSANVLPAGTMNPLMLTVVHLTALLTSFKDEIVPTQLLLATGVVAMTVVKEIRANEGRMAGHIAD